MTEQKLKDIIARKNEQLEQNAVSYATEIINAIAECQQNIVEANKRIEALRGELKALEIQQIKPESILGA